MIRFDAIRATWRQFHAYCKAGKIASAWAVSGGGVAEGLMKMSFGNKVGFLASGNIDADLLFSKQYGTILAECTEVLPSDEANVISVGNTVDKPAFLYQRSGILHRIHSGRLGSPLESVYPTRVSKSRPH